MRHHPYQTLVLGTSAFLLLPGCSDGTSPDRAGATVAFGSECTIPPREIFSGARKDGIPALSDPPVVEPGAPSVAYLDGGDRVIGIVVDGEAVAVPLNALWWHEVANVTVGDRVLAVTHCPLTGSSLVFDRAPLQGVEFGVSGLLYKTNLIMYDRSNGESLWPQMARGARCGPRTGSRLAMIPAMEMRWDAWRALHPGTGVVASGQPGFDYDRYPYGTYDDPNNGELLFPIGKPIDLRRPPKERVLGIPLDGPLGMGIAFPFGELGASGRWGVASETVAGQEFVVLYDGEAEAAMAYRPLLNGDFVRFDATAEGIVDEGTGSTWSVEGVALSGPLEGSRLVPVDEAYVAFWFAWEAFHPGTELWER